MPIPATASLTALLAVLLVALAANVSRLRMKHRVSLGDGGNPQLLRALRVHGNTAEHVPTFLLTALAYELTAGTTPLLFVLGGVFVAARLLFAWGLLARTNSKQRLAGAAGTYGAELLLALALGAHALGL